MQNPNASLWPQFAANSGEALGADPWGLGSVIEAQARLWNHLLDANRSLWSFYTPWLQAAPSVWGVALAPLEHDERGEEPAKTADGVPDALEIQARSWNHFIDANRNFWTATTWQWPAAAWPNAGVGGVAAHEEAEETEEKAAPRRTHATTAARKSTQRTRASRSK